MLWGALTNTARKMTMLPDLCINFDSTTNLSFDNPDSYLLGKTAYYWSGDLVGKPLKMVADDKLPLVWGPVTRGSASGRLTLACRLTPPLFLSLPLLQIIKYLIAVNGRGQARW